MLKSQIKRSALKKQAAGSQTAGTHTDASKCTPVRAPFVVSASENDATLSPFHDAHLCKKHWNWTSFSIAAGVGEGESGGTDWERARAHTQHNHNTGALPVVCEAEWRCQPPILAQQGRNPNNDITNYGITNYEQRSETLCKPKAKANQTRRFGPPVRLVFGSIVGAGIQKIQATVVALPECKARFKSRLGFWHFELAIEKVFWNFIVLTSKVL